jgi:hypothetical protein
MMILKAVKVAPNQNKHLLNRLNYQLFDLILVILRWELSPDDGQEW